MRRKQLKREIDNNTSDIIETGGRLIGLVAKRVVLSFIDASERPKRKPKGMKRLNERN